MVISAQAEPLVRPYFEATPRQVQGLVTSLPGGAAYGPSSAGSRIARTYWDSFSLGLVVVEVLLVIGGIYYLLAISIRGRETEGIERGLWS